MVCGEIRNSVDDMAISRYLLLLVIFCLLSADSAAVAQYDNFALPPGAEYTPIPKRLHQYSTSPQIKAPDAPVVIAYGLKEFRLGMSLDDFTKSSGPGGSDPLKVKAICSCEANQSIEIVTEEDHMAKVVQCGFWNKQGEQVNAGPYRMTVAGVQCSPDFRFIEDGGVYRLYEISIAFYSSNFKDMEAALVAKYGPPSAEKQEKMKTEMGNLHRVTNLIWDNGVSRIRLSSVDGNNTGRAKLRYIHERLAVAYASRVNDHRSAPTRRASDDL